MKLVKLTLAILLVMILALGLGVPALASEADEPEEEGREIIIPRRVAQPLGPIRQIVVFIFTLLRMLDVSDEDIMKYLFFLDGNYWHYL